MARTRRKDWFTGEKEMRSQKYDKYVMTENENLKIWKNVSFDIFYFILYFGELKKKSLTALLNCGCSENFFLIRILAN